MPIDDVFAQTRVLVNQQTNGAVVPWSASKVKEPYFIFERAPDAPPPAGDRRSSANAQPSLQQLGPDEAYAVALQRDTLRGYQEYLAAFPDSPQARRVRAILAARREAMFWRRSVDENSPRAYWTYLRVYPRGRMWRTPGGAWRSRPRNSRRRRISRRSNMPICRRRRPTRSSISPGRRSFSKVRIMGRRRRPRPAIFSSTEESAGATCRRRRRRRALGFLPVLPLAIPLLVGAKRLHHKGEEYARATSGPARRRRCRRIQAAWRGSMSPPRRRGQACWPRISPAAAAPAPRLRSPQPPGGASHPAPTASASRRPHRAAEGRARRRAPWRQSAAAEPQAVTPAPSGLRAGAIKPLPGAPGRRASGARAGRRLKTAPPRPSRRPGAQRRRRRRKS